MPLKCDNCKKEAIMFYIAVIDGKSSVVCSDCNKKKKKEPNKKERSK